MQREEPKHLLGAPTRVKPLSQRVLGKDVGAADVVVVAVVDPDNNDKKRKQNNQEMMGNSANTRPLLKAMAHGGCFLALLLLVEDIALVGKVISTEGGSGCFLGLSTIWNHTRCGAGRETDDY